MKYVDIQPLFESFKDAKQKFIEQGASKEEASSYIIAFKQIQQRLSGKEKDISNWIKWGWQSFKIFVDQKSEQQSKREQLKVVKEKGALKILDTPLVSVILPLTHEASCYYGANTRWCIASKVDGEKGSFEYYHDIMWRSDFFEYISGGNYIYVVNFKKPVKEVVPPEEDVHFGPFQSKIAIHVSEDEFFDEQDNTILVDDVITVLKYYGIEYKDLKTLNQKLLKSLKNFTNSYALGTYLKMVDLAKTSSEMGSVVELYQYLIDEGILINNGKRIPELEKKIYENPIDIQYFFSTYMDTLSAPERKTFNRDWIKPGNLLPKAVYRSYETSKSKHFYDNVEFLFAIWEDHYEPKRWPSMEEVLKLEPSWAISYSIRVGKRIKELEPYMLKDDFTVTYFDQDVIEYYIDHYDEMKKDPWIEAIKKYPRIVQAISIDELNDGERIKELEPIFREYSKGYEGLLNMLHYYDHQVVPSGEQERWKEIEALFGKTKKKLLKDLVNKNVLGNHYAKLALERLINYAGHNGFTKWKSLYNLLQEYGVKKYINMYHKKIGKHE